MDSRKGKETSQLTAAHSQCCFPPASPRLPLSGDRSSEVGVPFCQPVVSREEVFCPTAPIRRRIHARNRHPTLAASMLASTYKTATVQLSVCVMYLLLQFSLRLLDRPCRSRRCCNGQGRCGRVRSSLCSIDSVPPSGPIVHRQGRHHRHVLRCRLFSGCMRTEISFSTQDSRPLRSKPRTIASVLRFSYRN